MIAPMSERGLPTEGAPACPFVAFEDDRDGRSTAPDHLHRCFAEPRPAPRALAHQEAYCLSSAFPVCPTFQDWARREAAAARPTSASQAGAREDVPASRPAPAPARVVPPDRAPYEQQAGTFPPSRRSTQRDWAAPPPWVGSDADDRAAKGAAVGGAAGAGAAAIGAAGWGSEASGLAGSPADRLAGPNPGDPRPATPAEPGVPDDDRDDRWRAGSADEAPYTAGADADPAGAGAYAAGAGAYPAGVSSTRPSDASRTAPPPRRSSPAPRSSADQVSKPVGQDPSELFGPAWERPKRYEAYPTLRTRMGLPALGGIPRVAVWGLLLLLAALLVFLFGPSLLGLGGNDGGGGSASPTPAATEQVSTEPEATEPPAPTPQVYVVVRNDTMSKIAKKFGLTLEELMAANPQIKNPNKIGKGDEITIPVPVEEGASDPGGDGTGGGESQAP
jgi:LysM repeat protein